MKSKILSKINHLISPLLPTRIDNKFQVPRIWSNAELRKFAHLFSGSIVNVSGWIDKDKEDLEFIVDNIPEMAGIDPYYYLIDKNTDDNIVKMKREK